MLRMNIFPAPVNCFPNQSIYLLFIFKITFFYLAAKILKIRFERRKRIKMDVFCCLNFQFKFYIKVKIILNCLLFVYSRCFVLIISSQKFILTHSIAAISKDGLAINRRNK